MPSPSISSLQENELSNPLFSLAGRTALVTGSSRGLGLAIATGLAEAGAAIVLNGVNQERLQESLAALEGRGFSASGAAFDGTDEAAVVTAFEAFDLAGVEIDIIVNNAGIQYHDRKSNRVNTRHSCAHRVPYFA